jgi:hypothetical protein
MIVKIGRDENDSTDARSTISMLTQKQLRLLSCTHQSTTFASIVRRRQSCRVLRKSHDKLLKFWPILLKIENTASIILQNLHDPEITFARRRSTVRQSFQKCQSIISNGRHIRSQTVVIYHIKRKEVCAGRRSTVILSRFAVILTRFVVIVTWFAVIVTWFSRSGSATYICA